MKNFFMEIALKTLCRSRRRFIYPFIGTMVGIAAVIAIFSMAEGGKRLVDENLAGLSENRVIIKGLFRRQDIEHIESLPIVSYTHLTDAVRQTSSGRIAGYGERALKEKNLNPLRDGEIIIEAEAAERQGISPGSYVSVDADNSKINMRAVDTFTENSLGIKNYGIISRNYFDRLFGIYGRESRLLIAFYPEEDARESAGYVLNMMRRKNPREDYELIEDDAAYRKVKRVKSIVSIMLGSISFISLLAAGITISNMLTSSVRERTGEIGILMAMGTGRENIRKIFLLEALIISILGGAAGIILGAAGAALLGIITDIPPVFQLTPVLLTLAASVLLGILSGIKPADAAARMSVIEALKK